MYLIFTNQKNEDGIFSQKLFPIVAQDSFLKIKTKQGFYTAINRLKKENLIEKKRIKKIPPENFISLKKKGLDELNIFSEIMFKFNSASKSKSLSQKQPQEESKTQSLKLSLEKSQEQVKSLTLSLEKSQSQSQKNLLKKLNTEKEMVDLDESEYKKRVKRIKVKIIDGVNMDEEDFSPEQLETIEETAEDILDYARE